MPKNTIYLSEKAIKDLIDLKLASLSEALDCDYEDEEELNIKEQNWIPVNKKLPKNNNEVIVTSVDNWGQYETFVTRYLKETETWEFESDISKIIAWMPMPQPYKEEQE